MIDLIFDVDTSELDYFITVLEGYDMFLDDDKIITALVKRGVELLKDEASKAHYKFSDGQKIENGMKGEVESNTRGIIYNNEKEMPFVEFGTGVIGQGTAKINQEILSTLKWTYDERENGWWYKTDSKPPEGQPSKYDKETGQWYAWTRGQEAKNIFYNATQRLEQEMPSIINNVLKQKGGM